MRGSAKLTLFLMVFLVSCASPAPEPTVTAVPSSTHTAIPTSRESLESPSTTPEGDVLFFEADGSEWQANDDQIHHTPGSETLWIQTEDGLFVFDSETTEWDKVDDLAEGSGIYGSGGKQFVLMGDQLLWLASVSEADGETQVVTKDGKTLVWEGEWQIVAEVNMTFDQWKELISGPFTYSMDGSIYPERWANFTEQNPNGIKAYYTDPEQIEKLSPGTALCVMNPSGEFVVWATPSEAAEMARDGATAMETKSISPIAQVWMVVNAANEHTDDGQAPIWVTFGENSAITFSMVAYMLERDLVGPLDADGKFTNPAIPVPPEHFKVVYRDADGKRIVEDFKGEFKDPNHWIQELIDAGYEEIEFYPH